MIILLVIVAIIVHKLKQKNVKCKWLNKIITKLEGMLRYNSSIRTAIVAYPRIVICVLVSIKYMRCYNTHTCVLFALNLLVLAALVLFPTILYHIGIMLYREAK